MRTPTGKRLALNPSNFLDIHRSRIVHVANIVELRSIENREFVVGLFRWLRTPLQPHSREPSGTLVVVGWAMTVQKW
jgi:hypothetical protein